MRRSALRPIRKRPKLGRQSPVAAGMAQGLLYGLGFTVLAALVLVARPSGSDTPTLRQFGLLVGFYLTAGLLGGAIFGLMRPLQDRYAGRVLTAYIILYLVYGGGTATLLPLLKDEPVPVRPLLVIWAILCLVLAPIYEATMRDRNAAALPGPPAT